MEIIENKRSKERLEMPDGSWDKMLTNGLSRSHKLIEKTGLKPKVKSKEIISFLEKSKPEKKEEVLIESETDISKPIKKKPYKNKSNERTEVINESARKDFK